MMNTSVAKINLSNLRHNIREYRNLIGETTQMIAVIKADGYGHGVMPVSRIAHEEGIDFFAISRVKEGIELKEAGIMGNIIILGGTLPEEMKSAVEYDLIPTVYNIEQLQALEDAAAGKDKKAKFHLKIDTGMHRLGVKCGSELEKFLDALDDMENVYLSGVYSHFAVSDVDPVYTKEQHMLFTEALRDIHKREYMPNAHISNSAAIASFEAYNLDFVRLGIGMYGLNPQNRESVNLKPVMSLHAHIVHIHEIEKGETVSYGRMFKAKRKTKVAVLPIGYADGYPRILSNKAQVLIGGKRCNLIGTVCMDHVMVDVTDVDCQLGDEVVMIGQQGDEEVTAKELADLAGTIHYEIVTGIQKRIKRVYIE
ncbi:MAG: alanine racemase [Eubacteriales bacterium]